MTAEDHMEPDIYEQLEEEAKRDDAESRRPPEIVMMVGMPGSGKSTLCNAIIEQSFPQRRGQKRGFWYRISQDDLRSRWACEELCIQHLLAGHNVLIDRCNFTESQRLPWIEIGIARGAKIGCLVMAVSPEACIERAQNRWNHPNLAPGKWVPQIIDSFWQGRQMPDLEEGIEWCRYVYKEREGQEVIDMLLRK